MAALQSGGPAIHFDHDETTPAPRGPGLPLEPPSKKSRYSVTGSPQPVLLSHAKSVARFRELKKATVIKSAPKNASESYWSPTSPTSVHDKDPSVDVLLTENEYCGTNETNNLDQLNFFQKLLEEVHIAVHNEMLPVIGYTTWSFLDNYEWGFCNSRFGLYYVNFTSETGSADYYEPKLTDHARIMRPDAKWFTELGCRRVAYRKIRLPYPQPRPH